jgi:predicted dehydrogenase
MRRNGPLAMDYASRHNVARWYDDAEKLINDPDVDAVYIATPPDSHKQYTMWCAALGKPVLVEKPMALDTSECQEMLDACRSSGTSLYVAYYRRMLPRFLTIRDLIRSGKIGQVRMITISHYRQALSPNVSQNDIPWRFQPKISGGGLFVDLGSHMLDFFDYVFGPIRQIRGFAINQANLYPAEDLVVASFTFGRDICGSGTWCYSSSRNEDKITIVGSRGEITFAFYASSPIRITTVHGTQSIQVEDPPHVHQPLIQSIVDELNGDGYCPSTGESALRTTQVMDGLLLSYHTPMQQ